MEELTAPEDMTPDGIRRALDVAGLGHLWARIEPELLPALAITTVAANNEELPPGSSKFGGLPDLPEGEDWPLTEYRIPFAFLAQFNLAEVHRLLPTDDTLPTSGLLSFFYFNDYYYTFHPRQFGRLTEAGSWEPLPDGFWGEHGGGTAVGGVPLIRYIPASAPLARVAPPTLLMEPHPSARLALRLITTAPGYNYQTNMIIGAGQDDFARYVREISPIQENICYDDHLLLGNDIGLHAGGDDMIEKISEEEGVDISKGWSNPGTAATLLLALRRWRHLATIKYDEIVDFRFGKAGDLIFMVPGAEAWQGDFSGVRVFNPFV